MKKIITFSLIAFIVDQLVKLLIGFSIDLNGSFCVIENFFYISNVRNYGAAFSLLYGNVVFLTIISIFALFLIFYYISKQRLRKIDIITYSLLLGGIYGNLFDRLVYGYVVDFFDFYIFGYNFPVFNIADICIVCSMFIILYDTFRGGKFENRCR